MTGLTVTNPAHFADVCASGRIVPGDTIKLRGNSGPYRGYYEFMPGGTEANPVVIKPYGNESPIIDGGFTFNSPYVKVYDLEIMDSDTDRYNQTDSITMNQVGCWLIGCDIHDLHNSGVSWFSSGVGGIAECIIRNNGYRNPDNTGHGHGIYSHNQFGGQRQILRNLFFDQIGDYGVQLYGSAGNNIKDYIVSSNISANDPHVIGGGGEITNVVWEDFLQFQKHLYFGVYSSTNTDMVIQNNRLIDLSVYDREAFVDVIETGNTVWGGPDPWPYPDGYTVEAKPATWSQFTAFSLSNRWIGSLALYDRDGSGSVQVDFTDNLANGIYILRNHQNPSETYSIDISENLITVIPTDIWTAAPRIGDTSQPTTAPNFIAFVLEKV